MQRPVFSIFPLVLLLSPALAAQTMILEAEPGVENLESCGTVHQTVTCEYLHFEGELAPSVGSTIQLDGRSYILEWMGPGYYLESGVVVQPFGKTVRGLRGQRWLEVYPNEGKMHTSRAWKDLDGNRTLNALDTLSLDSGPALRVKDVRLQMRVRPAPPEP
jgi:hypothetical protein